MTTKEAAEILGVNMSRVRQLILSGDLKAEKYGRDWYVTERSLKAYQKRRPPLGRPKVKADA